jgi:hypothetical protein
MMTGFEQYTRKTRRAIFLEEMEQVAPVVRAGGAALSQARERSAAGNAPYAHQSAPPPACFAGLSVAFGSSLARLFSRHRVRAGRRRVTGALDRGRVDFPHSRSVEGVHNANTFVGCFLRQTNPAPRRPWPKGERPLHFRI